MQVGRLSPLQTRVLHELAGLEPSWTLSGGGALVGFHTQHRETRDLDLFWQGRRELGALATQVASTLRTAGLAVDVLQTELSFARLSVRDVDGETVLVDLVADPVPLAEAPREVLLEGRALRVDTPHQILVNKLCAMLTRSEVRDLRDVDALIGIGGDLARAVEDAPGQDMGFSAITLAWTLRRWPLGKLAAALGESAAEVASLDAMREKIVERLLVLAVPQ